MAAISLGSGTLAGAGAIAAVTRGPWRVTALLVGAGLVAVPATRGPWRVTAAMVGGSDSGFVADFTQPVKTKFSAFPLEAAIPLYRAFAAPPSAGVGAARSVRAVTPSDSIPLDPGCVGLEVTVTGTLTVKGLYDGASVSLGTQAAGTTIPGRYAYVMASGTGATVVALYA